MTVPVSTALTEVPSGTARLMPSFFSPFGLVPKPEMMRPRTGQRNDLPSAEAASAALSIAAVADALVAVASLAGLAGMVGIAGACGAEAMTRPVSAVSAGGASRIFGGAAAGAGA